MKRLHTSHMNTGNGKITALVIECLWDFFAIFWTETAVGWSLSLFSLFFLFVFLGLPLRSIGRSVATWRRMAVRSGIVTPELPGLCGLTAHDSPGPPTPSGFQRTRHAPNCSRRRFLLHRARCGAANTSGPTIIIRLTMPHYMLHPFA